MGLKSIPELLWFLTRACSLPSVCTEGGCRVELIPLPSPLPPDCGFSGFPGSAESFKQPWAGCRQVKTSSVPFISAHARALPIST